MGGAVAPRAFDLARLNAEAASPWDAAVVLHNSHVSIRLWRAPKRMKILVRNADGDDLIFVHEGQGTFSVILAIFLSKRETTSSSPEERCGGSNADRLLLHC